ncbi:MAG: protein kinase domain-containing protein [Pyrinomonadaceae bacterium]
MIEPGTLLQNRYRLDRQIGRGGMGAVYVATDERFGSTVAVKETLFDDPVLRKAFEREAHLLNRLRHASLPKVSDHFTEGEGQFLVMEFIEGQDLSALLEQRGAPFPVADVLGWADELLDALDYLHTHEPQIVHRDIKPQNLKLTPRGQIILLDFGLAKGALKQTCDATAAASVFGYSRHYARLEQIQGAGTDPRSDLYSLAATLYHFLTGAAPVDALTRATAAVNNQPDPLRPAHRANAQVPEAVSHIIQRGMAQKSAQRPQTAREMRVALARAAKSLPAGAHTLHASDLERTIVEKTAHAFDAERHNSAASHAPRDASTARRAQAGRGESTLVEGTRVAERHVFRADVETDSQTVVAHSANRSRALLVGVVLALLVACAAVPFAISRYSDSESTITQPRTATPADANADAPESGSTSPAQSGSGDAGSSRVIEPSSASSQPDAPRASSAPSANTDRSVSGDAGTNATSGTSSDGAAADRSSRAPSDLGTGAGEGGLVIQRPASAATTENTAAAQYDAQRAENLRKQREEAARPRPVEERYAPPPGGGPPPPPFDARRPPPRQPPPAP